MSATPRGIAVVLDGPRTPSWQARALAQLRESSLLCVLEVRTVASARGGAQPRRMHTRLERRLLRLGRDALAPAEVDGRSAAGVAGGASGTGGPKLAGGTAAAVDEPTLVVWLAECPPPATERGEVLYLRHAGASASADDAFGRALAGGAGVVETEVLLRPTDQAEDAIVVERTVSGVRPFSLTLSRDLALWKLAPVVRRAAERATLLEAQTVQVAPALAPAARAPSNAALVARSLLVWPRILLTRALFRRPWSVRVRRRGAAPIEGWSGGGRSGDQGLVRFARGHLYADPFLFEHEGRHHLFCEEVPPGRARAVISHTELYADGRVAERPSCVLSRPYHLSYPFVFAHEGAVFMIPESSAVERVELYRAIEFPRVWELDSVLLERLDAADATLLQHGDRLWLFAGVAAPDASSLDELHLFSASTLRGPWSPHPRNPVVSDARRARPAGAVQRWGSRLIRPGQDGSRRYGGAVAFCEIDVLSEDEYAEHEVARLEPAAVAGARATHTYTSDRAFEAIDLRTRELRLAAALAGRRFAKGGDSS